MHCFQRDEDVHRFSRCRTMPREPKSILTQEQGESNPCKELQPGSKMVGRRWRDSLSPCLRPRPGKMMSQQDTQEEE